MASQDTPRVPSGPPPALVVGAASRDLAPSDPRGWRLGGAVSYCSLTLARLGVPVRALLGADREAAGASELDTLRAAGVEVSVVPLANGPVFENREGPDGRSQLCISASAPVRPEHLPPAWGRPSVIVLAPVADELPEDWATVAASASLVALSWQGLLRTLSPGAMVRRRAPWPSALAARADLVSLAVDDIDRGTTVADLLEPLAPSATLVLTRGVRGGIVATRTDGEPRLRRYPAIPPARTVDPTGAGDVFLAALVAACVSRGTVPVRIGSGALRLAAAAASLAVEAPGLAGVADLAAVLARASEAGAPR
jgi:sugar/nucleoside kinase (ribokinase family)